MDPESTTLAQQRLNELAQQRLKLVSQLRGIEYAERKVERNMAGEELEKAREKGAVEAATKKVEAAELAYHGAFLLYTRSQSVRFERPAKA